MAAPAASTDTPPSTAVQDMAGKADPSSRRSRSKAAAAGAGDSARRETLRFIDRMRNLRAMGVGLAFLMVAGVLYTDGANPFTWALLVLHGFVWPHLAWFLSRRDPDPQKAELRNLIVDSGASGIWIVLMNFKLLPGALLIGLCSMDKVSVGGWRFLARTAGAQALVAAVTLA